MKNPILKNCADPDAAVFNGKMYVYPTTDGVGGWDKATSFKVYSSEDLENWKDEGVILDFKDVPWTEGICAWAPAICEKNGKYYFYFTGHYQIGVAVSDSPTGKFEAKDSPLIEKVRYDTIDPDVFIDDDGQAYLYWGNTHMYVAKLAENMMELASEPMEITPSNYNEGTCVFKRNGIYYYTWSKGDTRSPDYHVRYGKGTSPMQKPEGDTVILHRDFAEDKRIRCTAHHTIVNIPGTDEWYILYHRFNVEKYGDVEGFSDEAGSQRETCIDRLYFDEDGNILPVKPTNE